MKLQMNKSLLIVSFFLSIFKIIATQLIVILLNNTLNTTNSITKAVKTTTIEFPSITNEFPTI